MLARGLLKELLLKELLAIDSRLQRTVITIACSDVERDRQVNVHAREPQYLYVCCGNVVTSVQQSAPTTSQVGRAVDLQSVLLEMLSCCYL